MELSSQRSVVPYSHGTSNNLTPVSLTQLQRRFWVLPASRLRFVLAADILETEIMLECLALEGTKQV